MKNEGYIGITVKNSFVCQLRNIVTSSSRQFNDYGNQLKGKIFHSI